MFENVGEAVRQKIHSYDEVVTNDKIRIMQKVAPDFGVTIQILAEEGKPYSHQYVDKERGQLRTYTGKVPEGQSHIMISSQEAALSNFYNAVQAERKAKQIPTNPPKA